MQRTHKSEVKPATESKSSQIPILRAEDIARIQAEAEEGVVSSQLKLGSLYEVGKGVSQDSSKAFYYFQKAAEQGEKQGQFKVAFYYKNGIGVQKDEKAAVEWCQKSANQGHPQAAYIFAHVLLQGDGVEKDEKKALDYFRISANGGDAFAQVQLGKLLLENENDRVEAVSWLKKAKKQDHPSAITLLGRCAEEGLGMPQNLKAAKKWYQKAASLNDRLAKYNLFRCLKYGIGCEKDEKAAIPFCLAAAEQGLAMAQYKYSQICWSDKSMGQNDQLSFQWLKRAAEQGYAKAQTSMGIAYRNGNLGLPCDLIQGLSWIQKAASQGHADAEFELAYYLSNGIGMAKDEKKAVELIHSTAKKGVKYAQYQYGMTLINGCAEVKPDANEAVQWLLKAAEQGVPEAEYNLGVCYASGKGVPQDKKVAFDWYLKAAKKDNPDAAYVIGKCFFKGIVVEEDLKEAATWFRLSAEKGNVEAQNAYGSILQAGQGVEKNHSLAFSWFQKAAAQGFYKAEINLAEYLWFGFECEKDEKQAVLILQKHAEINTRAKTMLGFCLLHGKGIEKDEKAAVGFFQKAAEQNNEAALINLGYCYEFGTGLEKDEKKAVEFYQKAINNSYASFSLARCLELGKGIARDEKQAYVLYEKLESASPSIPMFEFINLIKTIEEKLEKIKGPTFQNKLNLEFIAELDKINQFCRDAKEKPDCIKSFVNFADELDLKSKPSSDNLIVRYRDAGADLLRKINAIINNYSNYHSDLKKIQVLFGEIKQLLTAIEKTTLTLTPLLSELTEKSWKKPASFKIDDDRQRHDQLIKKYLDMKEQPYQGEASDYEVAKDLGYITALCNSLADKAKQCDEFVEKIETEIAREKAKAKRPESKKDIWQEAKAKKDREKAKQIEEAAARKKEIEEKQTAKKAQWLKAKEQTRQEQRKAESPPEEIKTMGVEFVLGGDLKSDAKPDVEPRKMEESKPNSVLRTKFLDQTAKYCLFLAVTLNQFQTDIKHCKDEGEKALLERKIYYAMLYNFLRTVVALRLYQHFGKTEELPQDQLVDIRDKMMHGAASFITLEELKITAAELTQWIPHELLIGNGSISKKAFARLKHSLSLTKADEDKAEDFKLNESPALQTVMAFELKTKQEEKEISKLNDNQFIALVWPLIKEFKEIYKTLEKKAKDSWFVVMEYGHCEVHALKMIMTMIGEYTKLHECGNEIAKDCLLGSSAPQNKGWFYDFLTCCRMERGETGHEFTKEFKGSTENANSIINAYQFLVQPNLVEHSQPKHVKENFRKKSREYPHFHQSSSSVCRHSPPSFRA